MFTASMSTREILADYSRDDKKGRAQIEYGLLTDPEGRPVAIRVFAGNTADPAAFTHAIELVRDKFALSRLTLVGDRGMITSARIEALKELGGLSGITCLRAPGIATLAAEDGPLQLTLFDTQDLAEITHPDYPADQLNTPSTVTAYKNLSRVEQDSRSLKTIDVDLRPIHHYLSERVRAHVLICMLACYLTWHLCHALAELTYTDEHPPTPDNPIGPATRSNTAQHKTG